MSIVVEGSSSPRVRYAAERLKVAIGDKLNVTLRIAPGLAREGYRIESREPKHVLLTASDDSGLLYGALDLARRAQNDQPLATHDAPVFTLRGAVIGLQKTFILPGRKVYEYPYTPELFPFFYDKSFWSEYLDYVCDQRMNVLFLWNGHPFSSLVKVPGYEYALEVTEDVFRHNVEMFHHITKEADRRGVWVVQNFYSLLLPKPFADHHGLQTQLTAPTPESSDYTRKALTEFVKEYPHVGIMPCLGEALQGIDNQRYWLCDVILSGIKDGMKLAGLTEEPPVVIRTHATDLRKIMPDALKVYKNLYTEAKFNGESLTTHEPRGVRQQVHLAMSTLGSTHVSNVHILANLEPFRYGAQRFIQKCVQASRDRLGCKGLHLYPLAYWAWPDAPDIASPPLKQIDRDWMWYEAWARYAWNPDHDPASDRAYWTSRLTTVYGSPNAAEHILDALNDAGECAPRILRRFGITEGNRQTMALGMLLDQLVDPSKYRPFEELWESQSPPGERLQEYAERTWKNLPHDGETPPQIVAEIIAFSDKAVKAIDQASAFVTRNREEFERVRNDVYCIQAMSLNYAEKANAALCVLRYGYSKDVKDMRQAREHLAKSLEHYRALAKLTDKAYHFANTMQTSQRRIPVAGGMDGQPANYHWRQLVSLYETELEEFDDRVKRIESGKGDDIDETGIKRWPKASMQVVGDVGEMYEVQFGAAVFADQENAIRSVAPEIAGLTGIRFAKDRPYAPVEIEVAEPVYVLVGYFKSKDAAWRQPPDLETDADAEDLGGTEPVLQNAIAIDGKLPPLDIYALRYNAGRQKLELRGEGAFVIVGVVPQSAALKKRDAGRGV